MKTLTAYYSWSGNTRRAAELIAKETGSDLFEIEPVYPYPVDYNETVKQAKKEIREGYTPELKSYPDIRSYDTIFIGTPNWWDTMAPPVASFLKTVNLAGKIVAPFCTHGGGGIACCGRDIARMAAGAHVLESYAAYGGGSGAKDIAVWINKISGVKNG